MMPQKSAGSDDQRRAAAAAALAEVRDGMALGLGSGRTADHFVRQLGAAVRDGLVVSGVPTSEKTARLAEAEGIKLTTLDETPALDLTVDGADEVDPQLRLIKGGGGALLREKIVAAASERMIVVVDAAKCVETLGAFPLPIEVVGFGLRATRQAIERAAGRLGLDAEIHLRGVDDQPFVTDGGHYILDGSFGRIPDPEALAAALVAIPGVVDHGLFLGLASVAIVGQDSGVTVLSG
jgi:ribose 5-phosphate isomerase A